MGNEQMGKILTTKKKHLINIIKTVSFFFISLQIFLLLTNNATAYVVNIGVTKVLECEVTSFYFNSSTDLVKFNIEVQNRGSIAYKGRIRLDILKTSESNESYKIFTAWGPEKVFMPGDKKISEFYWYTNETGDFIAKVKVYYADEIWEKFFEIEKEKSVAPSYQIQKDIFKIKNFRTYDNFIVFDLVPKIDTKDVFIIPTVFTKGWIFEQKKIDSLKEGKIKTIVLPYKASVFAEDDLSFLIVSNEPKIYSEKTFTLAKKQGIGGYILYIVDILKIFLNRAK